MVCPTVSELLPSETLTDATGTEDPVDAVVVAATIFESAPNTALRLRTPRKATNWKL